MCENHELKSIVPVRPKSAEVEAAGVIDELGGGKAAVRVEMRRQCAKSCKTYFNTHFVKCSIIHEIRSIMSRNMSVY